MLRFLEEQKLAAEDELVVALGENFAATNRSSFPVMIRVGFGAA